VEDDSLYGRLAAPINVRLGQQRRKYRLFPRRRRRGFDPFSKMEDSDIAPDMGGTLRKLLVIKRLEINK